MFFGTLLLFFAAMTLYIGVVEIQAFGSLRLDTRREFSVSYEEKEGRRTEKVTDVLLMLENADGESRSVSVYRWFRGIAIGFLVLLGVRLIGFFVFEIPGERRRIARILSPLSELALKADELSRMSFSEDKYQLIEDALARLGPDESAKLSLGDTDLLGVEAAINNLLTRVRESNRQQARFVSDASHELRTPIAVIGGYADMLSRWGKDDEKVLLESITAIQTEARRMQHLVEQLLFLARGDSGRTPLKLEEVSLGDLVSEAYEESRMIDENHVYRLDVPSEEIRIQADAGLLKQALRILLDNAAKYTKEKDEIILSCGRADGRVYLQVQDTGIGMASSDAQHMFERFYRADKARSVEGTGLGLSIAKWIVDKHGGYFEIVSRTQIGTRIRIVL